MSIRCHHCWGVRFSSLMTSFPELHSFMLLGILLLLLVLGPAINYLNSICISSFFLQDLHLTFKKRPRWVDLDEQMQECLTYWIGLLQLKDQHIEFPGIFFYNRNVMILFVILYNLEMGQIFCEPVATFINWNLKRNRRENFPIWYI